MGGRSVSNPETALQHDILKYLELRGIFAWRNNSGFLKIGSRVVYLGPCGSPDIIGMMPDGRFLGIEVKQPKKKLSPGQVAFREKLVANRALIFVARSVADVEKALKEAK